MVFNSIHFVVFFAIVYAVYRLLAVRGETPASHRDGWIARRMPWAFRRGLLSHRAQNVWLLAASYYFYAVWDWRFTGLLAASTLVSYWARWLSSPRRNAHGIRRAIHPAARRCSSVEYSRYSPSSRLDRRASRPSRCDAGVSPRTASSR